MDDDFINIPNHQDLSQYVEYVPEEDIETTNRMPVDIVKIVFWITFYKVEYNLNFPCWTYFILVMLALGCIAFQFYACVRYLEYIMQSQHLEAAEEPPWIIHWLGIIVMLTELQHTIKQNLDAYLPSYATLIQPDGCIMYVALLLAVLQILQSIFMEGVSYYVICSLTNVSDVFINGSALLLIQQIDNFIGNIAKLLLKPYGEFLMIKEQDENLSKLYCVYTSVHTLSQFVLLMGFAACAYLYEPTHIQLLFKWEPYAIFIGIWIISIYLIDWITACRYKTGKDMFDSMLAGFTPRLDQTFDHFDEKGDKGAYNNFQGQQPNFEGGQRERKLSVGKKIHILSQHVQNLQNQNNQLMLKNETIQRREIELTKKFSDLQSDFMALQKVQNKKIEELMALVNKND